MKRLSSLSEYQMVQVDTFTDTPYAAIPTPSCPRPTVSTPKRCKASRAMNLSETSFVLPSQVVDFRCRYFTPAEEIPLAGHPTIATVHALAEVSMIDADQQRVSLELPAGVISVEQRRRP